MKASRRACCGLLLLLTSCSGSPSGSSAADDPLDISDVTYVGLATDEALLRLLDGTVRDDARQHVIIDSPELAEPLPRDTAPTFTFHLASVAVRSSRPPLAPRAWPGSLRRALAWLSPIGVAHAHGIPYSGNGYLLAFKDANGKRQLRVFTSQTSYTPDAAAWHKLTAAVAPLQLDITSAYFEENEIPDDGGPFVGGSFRLELQ